MGLQGHYTLKVNHAGTCPKEIDVRAWAIDVPHIPVLTVGSVQYMAPEHPSMGYPDNRTGHDSFKVSYGPGPEYDGPACVETATFNSASHIVFTSQKCDDGTVMACLFIRQ